MKKLFLILFAACSLTFMSCMSANESKCKEYLEQMTEQLNSGQSAEAIKTYDEYKAWFDALPADEQKELNEAAEGQLEQIDGAMKLLKGLNSIGQ